MPARHLSVINTGINDKNIGSTTPSSENATSRHHQLLNKAPFHSTLSTMATTTAILSHSSHEFRNGYRLQRQAYERKAQTQPLSSIISNRRSNNEYVDRLKRFYDLDVNAAVGNSISSEPYMTSVDKTVPNKHSQTRQNHPVEIKSVLRLPDVKTPGLGKSNNKVKIMLPLDASGAHGRQVVCAPDAGHFAAKIPPPVPVQLSSVTSHQGHGEDYLYSSLSSTMASSILEAVGELKKTSSTKKSSKTYQRQSHNRRHYANGHVDPKSLAMKMSLPCRIGCCYCVYSSLLGPVKVFLTRGQKPKQGPWVAGIRDGHGRLVIPVSRKSDVTGLVYDAHSHSLHPPAKGQRPMYQSSKGHEKDKSAFTEKKSIKNSRKEIKKRS